VIPVIRLENKLNTHLLNQNNVFMKSKLLLLSLALVLCASAHGQVASEVTTNDSTKYASKSHYTTDNFNSLDCFNSQYIVSVGDNNIFHLNCDFNFSMFMGCPNPNPIVIDPINIATPRLFNISPIVNGGFWSNIASPQTRITHPYNRSCYE
jgi:hypothetical protein